MEQGSIFAILRFYFFEFTVKLRNQIEISDLENPIF